MFTLIAQRGRVERAEMEKTSNMGVGMVAVVSAEAVDCALAVLTIRHVPGWTLGEVVRADDPEATRVELSGDHPRF